MDTKIENNIHRYESYSPEPLSLNKPYKAFRCSKTFLKA